MKTVIIIPKTHKLVDIHEAKIGDKLSLYISRLDMKTWISIKLTCVIYGIYRYVNLLWSRKIEKRTYVVINSSNQIML